MSFIDLVIATLVLGFVAFMAWSWLDMQEKFEKSPQGKYNKLVDKYNNELTPFYVQILTPVYDSIIASLKEKVPSSPINDVLLQAAFDILLAEFKCPDFPPLSNPQGWQAFPFDDLIGRFSDPNLKDQVLDIFLTAFANFHGALPEVPTRESILETRLLRLFHNAEPIEELFAPFQKAPEPLFKSLKASIEIGIKTARLGKYPSYSPSYMHDLLSGTPFAPLQKVEVPQPLPERQRFEGTWIIAPSGRGKTNLLSVLLETDLEAVKEGNASIIIMDAKGEFSDNAARLKCFAPGGDLYGKLTLIEPSATLALNPLDIGATAGHTIALLNYVFAGLLENEPSSAQSMLLRHLILACRAIPNATFSIMRSIITDGWESYRKEISTLHPDYLKFFTDEFNSQEMRATKGALKWRITDLITRVEIIRDMFSAPHTAIDIGAEMDAGKVIIIDNRAAVLADGLEFFSRFFIAMIQGAAEQRTLRSDRSKLPVYFYMDECDEYISRDENISKMLHKVRSEKIAMIFSHQQLQKIKSNDVKAALGDCGIKMANSGEEAPQLASRFQVDAQFLRGLRRGEFACFIRDYMATEAIKIPDNHIKTWDKMDEPEFQAIRASMRERYSYVPQVAEVIPIRGFAEDPDDPPISTRPKN